MKKHTDLYKFRTLYKSLGIDLKVRPKPNEGGCTITLNSWDDDESHSKIFGGHYGFYSEIEFDENGKFIAQSFLE